ncbi:MAG: site-specific integrase [Clostridia bacterium]|nr:site-specific integrase [Clostridia bacterium]
MPSYEKNKSSGLWSCRFREPDENGITHQRRLSGFHTKREAQYGYEDYIKQKEALRKEQARLALAAADPGSMLFDDLLDQYMDFTKHRVKESSYYDIESKVNHRLRPFFKGKRMGEITPKMISDWIEHLDYSYASKRWIFSTMSSLYRYGQKYFDVPNIIDKVDRPRNLESPKEMQIWTPEEFGRFIRAVDSRPYELYFRTLYVLGCRRGEAQALTWNDLTEGKLHIRKSLTTKTRGNSFLITTPKNRGSIRTIALPAFLAEQLRCYREEQQRELGTEWSPECFVFGGTRPLPTTTVDRRFSEAVETAGVKRIRIHDLRHSCASILISKGVSIVAVSRQLGHSNVEQTLNTYSHMMPDDQTLILHTLEALGAELDGRADASGS